MTALTRPSRSAGATRPYSPPCSPSPTTPTATALDPPQDLPPRRLPLSLLRRLPQPDRNLVRHGHLRQPHQGRRLPPAPRGEVIAAADSHPGEVPAARAPLAR